jgi:hypothetical protein
MPSRRCCAPSRRRLRQGWVSFSPSRDQEISAEGGRDAPRPIENAWQATDEARLFAGQAAGSTPSCPPVRLLPKGPGTLLRSRRALGARQPSAGDVTPSPWPTPGSRYDLSRLYCLRRRVMADGPRGSCRRLRRLRELPRDHPGEILISRPQGQEGRDQQVQRDRLVPGLHFGHRLWLESGFRW